MTDKLSHERASIAYTAPDFVQTFDFSHQPGACDANCQKTLYLTRQSRTAQGKGSMRLDRLWVITDSTMPPAELIAAHPDLMLARPIALENVIGLGGIKASPRYIHLVDRRGQIVMRYSDNPEPMKFIKEVGRLIKF